MKNFCCRVAAREIHDIGEVCSPERVNALRVIAHHHEVLLRAGHGVDDIRLELIGVLVFIHQDVLKALGVKLAQRRVFLHELQPAGEQVIKINQVQLFLFLRVVFIDSLNVAQVLNKVGIAPLQELLNRSPGYCGPG